MRRGYDYGRDGARMQEFIQMLKRTREEFQLRRGEPRAVSTHIETCNAQSDAPRLQSLTESAVSAAILTTQEVPERTTPEQEGSSGRGPSTDLAEFAPEASAVARLLKAAQVPVDADWARQFNEFEPPAEVVERAKAIPDAVPVIALLGAFDEEGRWQEWEDHAEGCPCDECEDVIEGDGGSCCEHADGDGRNCPVHGKDVEF